MRKPNVAWSPVLETAIRAARLVRRCVAAAIPGAASDSEPRSISANADVDATESHAMTPLEAAKLRFEHANEALLAAKRAWHDAAAEVEASGAEMTALYHEWARERSRAALVDNGDRRASVVDRVEQTHELLARPLPIRRATVESSNGDRSVHIGIAEWFQIGERDRVERVVETLHRLGVRRLRTAISWADWYTPDAPAWYAWLLPRLREQFDVL